eukprot:8810050-Lingulodinium_polyedra.AAC.1
MSPHAFHNGFCTDVHDGLYNKFSSNSSAVSTIGALVVSTTGPFVESTTIATVEPREDLSLTLPCVYTGLYNNVHHGY